MNLIKKISILCVFTFIFDLRPVLVESADIDEINIMLRKEKDKLSKLKNEIENQTKILNKMGRKEYSNLKKKVKTQKIEIFFIKIILNSTC